MKPRLAVLTSAHPWGDPRIFEREVASCLGWGWEVHLFMHLDAVPERRGWSDHPDLHVHPVPPPEGRLGRMLGALGFWRAVRREGAFQAIHFHDPELNPAAVLLGLLDPSAYLLYDIHEELPLEVESKPYLTPWIRRPLGRVIRWGWRLLRNLHSGFAPATEGIAPYWPEAETRVVHNYPKAVFAEATLRTPDPDRLICVGTIMHDRGYPELIEAVRLARGQRPGLRLELYGRLTVPEAQAWMAGPQAEGWLTHVPWMSHAELARTLPGAGLGLVPLPPLPNFLEALPTKMFEYMALGIPVLASDFPLFRELVEDSGAGACAVPEPGPLAAGILAMTADPAGLARMAAAGRAAFESRYRWEVDALNLRWHLDRANPGDPACAS